jgi:hypothetical protein
MLKEDQEPPKPATLGEDVLSHAERIAEKYNAFI